MTASGRGPLCDSRNLARVDGNDVLRDVVAEEADGGATKLTFGRLGVELVVPQRLEHHPDVHQMLLAGLGENEDIVAVHLHKTAQHRLGSDAGRAGVMQGPAGRFEDQGGVAEDVVHIADENQRHAMQAEGTDPELLLATGDAKRGLVLILRADSELHVGHRQIELGEEACAARLIDSWSTCCSGSTDFCVMALSPL